MLALVFLSFHLHESEEMLHVRVCMSLCVHRVRWQFQLWGRGSLEERLLCAVAVCIDVLISVGKCVTRYRDQTEHHAKWALA